MIRPLEALARHWPIDLGGRVENSVLVAGVGRGGTTWFAEFLNFDGRYRDLFEPLHAWQVKAAEPLRGHWRLRPGDRPPAAVADYLDRVIAGRVRAPWIDRFNRRLVADRRIIKEIRANLMLGWLSERHPDIKIILLIRHPAAAALSRLKLPPHWGPWQPTLAEMLEESALREALTGAQQSLCGEVADVFEEYVLTCAISQRIPLDDLPDERMHRVFYEDLVCDPEAAMRNVFAYLGEPWDARCLAAHQRNSRTARRRIPWEQGDHSNPAPWIAPLDQRQRDWVRRVLEGFGLDALYDESGFPRH